MADLEDAIEDAARGPLKMAQDSRSVEGRPISDLIAADQYLAKKKIRPRRGLLSGILVQQISLPGCGDDRVEG